VAWAVALKLPERSAARVEVPVNVDRAIWSEGASGRRGRGPNFELSRRQRTF
jgi:hypothetical protein